MKLVAFQKKGKKFCLKSKKTKQEEKMKKILLIPVKDRENAKNYVRIFKEGDTISIKAEYLEKSIWLSDGETVTLEESQQRAHGQGYYTALIKFTNRKGELIREDGEKDRKIAFAIDQANILQKEFDLSKDEAWKVIRASGPGMAVEAARYGQFLLDKHPEKEDFLVIALNHNRQIMGGPRAMEVLSSMGIDIPQRGRTIGDFFRIVQGARAYVRLHV